MRGRAREATSSSTRRRSSRRRRGTTRRATSAPASRSTARATCSCRSATRWRACSRGRPIGAMDPNLEGHPSQRLDNHQGKILRLNDDGTVPNDNPFVGRAGALPEIWSYGHRNPQGLALERGHEHALGDGARPARRRRAQRHREGQELRLARDRLRRELHARHRDPREPQQGRHGAAEGVLRAVDRHLGPHDLHGRQVPELEGQRVRRRHGRQLSPARPVLAERQRRHESRAAAAA